ncbi:hypothetical protein VXM60_10465 [Shewanella khirikhana]|uniref:hypothetical protein n=1 Tax=Shewanella khirikhana TaxID=1965282 RepID=UPI0030D5C2D1
MKGLLSIVGLVIALFVSSAGAETIYDVASYQPVVIKKQTEFYCTTNGTSQGHKFNVDGDVEATDAIRRELATNCDEWAVQAWNLSYSSIIGNYCRWGAPDFKYFSSTSVVRSYGKIAYDYAMGCSDARGRFSIDYYVNKLSVVEVVDQCEAPYSFSYDSDSDGEPDRCYDPNELANLSQCQKNYGSILPALTNISTSVCHTDPNTGAVCAYSRSAGESTYSVNLEKNCFSEDPPPDYEDGEVPQPTTCEKMSSDLMVCAEDPNEKCDFYTGVCQSDCGYFNGQFMCFTPCEGAECDADEPPETNCSVTPTHPACKEPEPDIPDNCKKSGAGMVCKEDPTEKCNEQGVCQDGCGYINDVFVCYSSTDKEGDLFKDLAPLIDELKRLGKNFEFGTTKGKGRESFGSFDTIFGDSDIAAIKQKALDKKAEASQTINEIKAEFKSMFSVSAPGGAYEQITLNLSYGTVKSHVWEFFQQYAPIIASAIMALAWMLAASIVMGGKND